MQHQRGQRGQQDHQGDGPVHHGVAEGQLDRDGVDANDREEQRDHGDQVRKAGKGVQLADQLIAAGPDQAQGDDQHRNTQPDRDVHVREAGRIHSAVLVDDLHVNLDISRQLAGQQGVLQAGGSIGALQLGLLGQELIHALLLLVDLGQLLVDSVLLLLGRSVFIALGRHGVEHSLLAQDLDHDRVAGVRCGDFLVEVSGGHIARGLLLVQVVTLGVQGRLPVEQLGQVLLTALEAGLCSLHFGSQQLLEAFGRNSLDLQALDLVIFTHKLVCRAGNGAFLLGDVRKERNHRVVLKGGDGEEHAQKRKNDQDRVDDPAIHLHLPTPLIFLGCASRSFMIAERISEQITIMPNSTTEAALAMLKLLGASKPCV